MGFNLHSDCDYRSSRSQAWIHAWFRNNHNLPGNNRKERMVMIVQYPGHPSYLSAFLVSHSIRLEDSVSLMWSCSSSAAILKQRHWKLRKRILLITCLSWFLKVMIIMRERTSMYGYFSFFLYPLSGQFIYDHHHSHHHHYRHRLFWGIRSIFLFLSHFSEEVLLWTQEDCTRLSFELWFLNLVMFPPLRSSSPSEIPLTMKKGDRHTNEMMRCKSVFFFFRKSVKKNLLLFLDSSSCLQVWNFQLNNTISFVITSKIDRLPGGEKSNATETRTEKTLELMNSFASFYTLKKGVFRRHR